MASQRIDVHHHFVPPRFADAAKQHGDKEWPTPNWTTSASKAILHELGASTAILSLTSPGVDTVSSVEDQLSVSRDANNTGASVRDADPSHFGFFTTIPNPVKYPKEALAEVNRAFDDLHADGVTLMTQYSGQYLGHAAFAPLWAELNRRSAVVFIHPTSPPEPYEPVSKALLPPSMDFTFETTRTAADLIFSGTITRSPNVKIILSHGGGTLPWTWHRLASLPQSMHMTDLDFETIQDQARSFYFDTALTGYGDNVDFLLRFAKPGHVMYGSDFPYAPSGLIKDMTKGMDEALERHDKKTREAVNWQNALELFPRLREYHEEN